MCDNSLAFIATAREYEKSMFNLIQKAMYTQTAKQLSKELRRRIGRFSSRKERVFVYEMTNDMACIKVLPPKEHVTILNFEIIYVFASYHRLTVALSVEDGLPMVRLS